jgi:hypothetical protein
MAKTFTTDELLSGGSQEAPRKTFSTSELIGEAPAPPQASAVEGPVPGTTDGEGYLGAAARVAGQGLTFGFGDEISAAVKTGAGYWGDYDQELESQRAKIQEFKTHRPWEAAGLEIAGSLPTMLIPGAAAVKGASLGARAVHGAKVGAVSGAAYGAGTGEGGVAGRALSTATGGTIGAAGGAVLGVAGRVAERAIPRAKSAVKRYFDPNEAALYRVEKEVAGQAPEVNAALRQQITPPAPPAGAAGLDEGQLAKIIERHRAGASNSEIASELGVHANSVSAYTKNFKAKVEDPYGGMTIGERARVAGANLDDKGRLPTTLATNELDDTLRTAARYTGPQRNDINANLTNRQLQQGTRLSGTVKRSFGHEGGGKSKLTVADKTYDDFIDYDGAVQRETQDIARGLYKDLDADTTTRIPTDWVMKYADDPLFGKALQEAFEASSRGVGEMVRPGQALTPNAVNRIQKFLRKKADQAWRGGDPNADGYTALHKDFLAEVADQYPKFKPIRQFYRGRMMREEAMRMGRKYDLTKESTTGEAEAYMRKLRSTAAEAKKSVAAAKKAKKGVPEAQAWEKSANNAWDDFKRAAGSNVLRDLKGKPMSYNLTAKLSTPSARADLEMMLGNEQATKFINHVTKESEMSRTFGRTVAAGPHTAELTEGFSKMSDAGMAGANLMTGDIRGFGQTVSRILGRDLTEKQAKKLVDVLGETDPAKVEAMLGDILRRADGRQQLEKRLGIPLSQAIAPIVGPNTLEDPGAP